MLRTKFKYSVAIMLKFEALRESVCVRTETQNTLLTTISWRLDIAFHSKVEVWRTAFWLADASMPGTCTATAFISVMKNFFKQVLWLISNWYELYLSMGNKDEELNSTFIQFYNRIPKAIFDFKAVKLSGLEQTPARH